MDWYTHGKRFFHAVGGDEAPVEGLRLEALKTVTDAELRACVHNILCIVGKYGRCKRYRKCMGGI
jgi:hypothetical protein